MAEEADISAGSRPALRRHGRARLLALLFALWSADALLLAGCPGAVTPEAPDRNGEGGGHGGGMM